MDKGTRVKVLARGFGGITGETEKAEPIRGEVCDWWYVKIDGERGLVLPFKQDELEVIDE